METNVVKFLWKYLARRKGLVFGVLFSVILGEFFIRFAAVYAADIIEVISSSVTRDVAFHKAMVYAVIAAGLFLLHRFCYEAITFMEAWFMPSFAAYLSKDLFRFVHKHSTAFFSEEMSGNIGGKIQVIINNSYQIYYNILWGFVYPFIGLVLSLFFIFDISKSLAFIMLVFSVIHVFVIYKMSKKLAPYSEARSKKSSESEGILVDSVSNASVVKSYSNYVIEQRKYFKKRREYVEADVVETIKFAWFFVGQGLIQTLIQVTFYIVPVWYWYKGYVDVAQFVLLQALIAMILNVSHHFSQSFSGFFKLYGGIQDGLKLLSIPHEVVDAPGAGKLVVKKAAVDFDEVMYHYKGKEPLFKDFELHIKPGEKVGLVGHSGSGKSTLVKILSRYYDIQKGEISIDGQDISKVTQDSLRRAISLIPQDPSLFNRTIMENIRYGKQNATDKEVYAAAKKAYCHEFISALPQGYESKVGERGVMLSGGERQRIAIARAILKDAPILVLDEATSALDSESEKYIHESLEKMMEGKTVIAIAHRLSTLREMDRIVVMDKGRIVEEGSHTQLLRKKGVYYGFYEMQSGGFLNLE